MSIEEKGPDEVLSLLHGVGVWRARGLRVRVRCNRVRVRLATGPESPLLKAVVGESGTGSQIHGRMHWAALYADILVRGIAPALLGLVFIAMGFDQDAWQPVAIGGALTLFMGAISIAMLRLIPESRRSEMTRLRDALAEVMADEGSGSRRR
jgi:hypothetical protein